MTDAPTPAPALLAARARFQQLGDQARALGLALRRPPPEPDTCCGRGCNGCVWEGFYDAAQWWAEDALAAIAEARAPGGGPAQAL